MALASWVIAPRLAHSFSEPALAKALVLTLTVGLIWQFVLTMLLVAREQRTLRWSVVRDALWLRARAIRGPASAAASCGSSSSR